MKHKIALLIALIVGYCVFVFALASTLMAQRYEYRATPIETGPITVPCFVVDRFNYLCIETGDIFVDVATERDSNPHRPSKGNPPIRTPVATPSIILAHRENATGMFVNVAGRQVGSGFRLRASFVATTAFAGQASERASVSAAATPSIILAHQKIASDAWVDRTKNKKGERCCDAGKDCHSLNPEEVKHVQGGVTIRLGEQTLFIPGEEIMPSEDGRYWVCYWGGQVKCFFAPYSGS